MNSPWIWLLLDVIMAFFVWRFKRTTDELVRMMLETQAKLLGELCLRTQGEEREHYRQLRARTQVLLDEL